MVDLEREGRQNPGCVGGREGRREEGREERGWASLS